MKESHPAHSAAQDDDHPLQRLARPAADLSLLEAMSAMPDRSQSDQMYITHTISQDLSGSPEEVISRRLAALGAKERRW